MSTTQRSFVSLLLFGGLFMCVGAFVFLMAIDVIHIPEEDINAPRWVLAAVGMTFALAGAMVSIKGIKNRFGNHPLFKWIYNALLLVFMLFFAAPFHWVAFGPGERTFESSTNVGSVTVSQGGGGEESGRVCHRVAGWGWGSKWASGVWTGRDPDGPPDLVYHLSYSPGEGFI
jgi:hypothetical protein